MCIYTYISILFLFLLYVEIILKNTKISKLIFLVGAIILLVLIGLRSEDVGPDTLNYVKFFDGTGTFYGTYESPTPDIEIGIVYFARFIRLISTDYWVWLMSTTILTIVPFLYLVNIGSRVRMIPLLLVIVNTYGILYLAMASMRQNLSLGFILLAFIVYYMSDVPKRKKIILTVTLILIATFFHQAAILVLPFMLLCNVVSFKRHIVIITLIASMVLGLIISDYAYSIFRALNFVTSIWGFSDRYFDYGKDAFETNTSLLYLAPVTLFVISYVLCCEEKEMKEVRLKYLILGCVLFNLGSSLTVIMRVVYPLTMIGITYVPMSFIKKRKTIWKFFTIVMFIVFVFLSVKSYSRMTKYDNNGIYPYTFFWE